MEMRERKKRWGRSKVLFKGMTPQSPSLQDPSVFQKQQVGDQTSSTDRA